MHFVMFLVICLLWGHSFLLMKIAEPTFGALGVAVGRQVLGAATLGVFWLVMRRGWPLRRSDFFGVVVLAAIGFALPFSVQPLVINRVQHFAGHGSVFAGFLVGFVPLLTVLVRIPMLGHYPSRREVVGVAGGLGFLALLFGAELSAGVPAWLLGVGALSPLGYALANTWVERRFKDAPPMGLAMSALAMGTILLLPPMVVTGSVRIDEHFALALAALVILGVVCSGLALALFYRLIQQRGPLYAGMVTYIIPCVALVVGWLDHESIAPRQVVAIAGIIVMVALVQTRPVAREVECV